MQLQRLRASWIGVLWLSVTACGAAQPRSFQEQIKSAPSLEGNSWEREEETREPQHAGKASDYFIGVECRPVPDALRAHLSLKEGEALLVEQVLPGSPGARAGIQRYDVLVGANNRVLKTVADLVKAIDSVGGKKLVLQITRAGKPIAIDVTPAKRPANMPMPAVPLVGPVEWDNVLRWLERTRPGEAGRPPLRFRLFPPGAILPPDIATLPPLPGDVTIIVTRQGGQPTKIHVSRNDRKWDVGESDLDKLPADIRPYVERMLGRGNAGSAFDHFPTVPGPSIGKP